MKRLYLISGKARHGKDTAAEFIKEYYDLHNRKTILTSLAKYIKMYAQEVSNWDGNEETKPRELLQQLGTQIIRQKLNKELLFINRLKDDIDIYYEYFDVVVIKDIRLPIEIEEFKESFPETTSIHVNRSNFETSLIGDEIKHLTETALDNYDNFDYVVINDNLENYKKEIFRILEEVEQK